MREKLPRFPYIRQVAKYSGLGISEVELRRMLAENKLPGFYTGVTQKYFRIDLDKLIKMLHEKSCLTGSDE